MKWIALCALAAVLAVPAAAHADELELPPGCHWINSDEYECVETPLTPEQEKVMGEESQVALEAYEAHPECQVEPLPASCWEDRTAEPEAEPPAAAVAPAVAKPPTIAPKRPQHKKRHHRRRHKRRHAKTGA